MSEQGHRPIREATRSYSMTGKIFLASLVQLKEHIISVRIMHTVAAKTE